MTNVSTPRQVAGVGASVIALTIAGSDSGGGAGLQADLNTFARFGVFGTSVVTAVTAQNTMGVTAWEPVSPSLVVAQIDAVAGDLAPSAFKCGMLGDAEVVRAVAAAIGRHRMGPFVLDPVMVATSGDVLLLDGGARAMVQHLVPLCALLTPNLPEASVLLSRRVSSVRDMVQAARELVHDAGAGAVLLKGGHLGGDVVTDVYYDGESMLELSAPRIGTHRLHGTGCTLSAAITAELAKGTPMTVAVQTAIAYVRRAIAGALALGGGARPLDHWA